MRPDMILLPLYVLPKKTLIFSVLLLHTHTHKFKAYYILKALMCLVDSYSYLCNTQFLSLSTIGEGWDNKAIMFKNEYQKYSASQQSFS
jgi:hypothetical protein